MSTLRFSKTSPAQETVKEIKELLCKREGAGPDYSLAKERGEDKCFILRLVLG